MKTAKNSDVIEDEDFALEQRADYIPAEDLIAETAPDSELFKR